MALDYSWTDVAVFGSCKRRKGVPNACKVVPDACIVKNYVYYVSKGNDSVSDGNKHARRSLQSSAAGSLTARVCEAHGKEAG